MPSVSWLLREVGLWSLYITTSWEEDRMIEVVARPMSFLALAIEQSTGPEETGREPTARRAQLPGNL